MPWVGLSAACVMCGSEYGLVVCCCRALIGGVARVMRVDCLCSSVVSATVVPLRPVRGCGKLFGAASGSRQYGVDDSC